VIDFSSMRNTPSTNTVATTVSTAATTTTPSTPSTTSTSSTAQPPKVKSSDAGSKMLQLAMARLEGKDIKSTDEIVLSSEENKKDNDTVTESVPSEAPSNNKVSKDGVDAVKESIETDENDVVEESKTSLATQTKAIDNTTENIIDDLRKSSLEEALSKTPTATEPPVTSSVLEPTATTLTSKSDENKDGNDVATQFRVYTKKFLLGYVDNLHPQFPSL
jgi:hypothetical protein